MFKDMKALTQNQTKEQNLIKFMSFSLLSSSQLQIWSVAEINDPTLFQSGWPVKGGPNDLRLGVSNMSQRCETCGQSRQCPGHFGHINLVEPVFHYGYMNYILQILKCVCHNCSKLKLLYTSEQKLKFQSLISNPNPIKRLNSLSKLLQNIKQCPQNDDKGLQFGCGCIIPTKIVLKNHKIILEERINSSTSKKYEYNTQKIYKILNKISDAQATILGFTKSKPKDLMISTLAVSPPQTRPFIAVDSHLQAQDDITLKYSKIIELNNSLKDDISNQRFKKINILENMIASIMVITNRVSQELDDQGNRIKKREKIKSIQQRLQSKNGRFRQNLMGKRVDFSARTVISPDSNIALDQIGVPQSISRAITIPQMVTDWNFNKMVNLCKKGKAKFIIRPSTNGVDRNVIYLHKNEGIINEIQKYLTFGSIVQRQITNGDYVLLNRQPSLHRMSMMAHKVKILPHNTFRLNLSVCSPYNADFDGDQMNMHVPQSLESLAQLKHLASVPKQIMAPKNNSPIMGLSQDSLLAMFLLTKRDSFLVKEQFMNLMMWIQSQTDICSQIPMPAILKPIQLWTGKQLISLCIPKSSSFQIITDQNCHRNIKDASLIIKNGQIITGILQKETIGPIAGGFIHYLWIQEGPSQACRFISNAQRLANNWLMINSFSVGIEDVAIDSSLNLKRNQSIQQIKKQYFDILNKYRDVDIIKQENLHQKGKKIKDSFEYNINGHLNNHLSKNQKFVTDKLAFSKNNIYQMITSKSKGSQTNLTQIIFFLGNQNVEGKRCPLGFYRRALPHFSKDDDGPQSRGFIFSNFVKGLKVHQYFFHSMGGREGLSDTSIKTSSIGYLQRKLVKALQDLSIKYDGSVRDSKNNLLQGLYGQDGFLSEYIQNHKTSIMKISQHEFQSKFKWDQNLMIFQQNQLKLLNEEYERLLYCRQRLKDIFNNQEQISYHCPIKISNILLQFKHKNQRNLHNQNQMPAKPHQIVQIIEGLIINCCTPKTSMDYRRLQKDRDLKIIRALDILYPSQIKFSQQIIGKIKEVANKILKKFKMSIAPVGQAIGAIAAQSIAQPTTQLTLNTFHLAGVSDKNVTLGLPRLKQLLDFTKSTQRSCITLFYKNTIKNIERQKQNALISELISFELPEKYIKSYLVSTKIYYDPIPSETRVNIPFTISSKCPSPWVISLLFDKSKLINSKIWTYIFKQLQLNFQKEFQILQKANRQDNQPEIIMRMNSMSFQFMKKYKSIDENDIFRYLCLCEQNVKQTFVAGVKGIKNVKVSKQSTFKNVNQLKNNENNNNYELILQAFGTNLRQCLGSQMFNSSKSYSNNLHQMNQIFGIQASRQLFINQFKQILKPYNIYINSRHLNLLADWISVRGFLTPINRFGINRIKDVSILRKAAFEQTSDILFGAAAFSQIDELKGVSQRLIIGGNMNIGTRGCQILIDREKIDQPQHKYFYKQHQELSLNKSILETTNLYRYNSQHCLETPNILQSTYFASQQSSPIYYDPIQSANEPIFSPIYTSMTGQGKQSEQISYNYTYQTRSQSHKSRQQQSLMKRKPIGRQHNDEQLQGDLFDCEIMQKSYRHKEEEIDSQSD